jgi:hypothetical protein
MNSDRTRCHSPRRLPRQDVDALARRRRRHDHELVTALQTARDDDACDGPDGVGRRKFGEAPGLRRQQRQDVVRARKAVAAPRDEVVNPWPVFTHERDDH